MNGFRNDRRRIIRPKAIRGLPKPGVSRHDEARHPNVRESTRIRSLTTTFSAGCADGSGQDRNHPCSRNFRTVRFVVSKCGTVLRDGQGVVRTLSRLHPICEWPASVWAGLSDGAGRGAEMRRSMKSSDWRSSTFASKETMTPSCRRRPSNAWKRPASAVQREALSGSG